MNDIHKPFVTTKMATMKMLMMLMVAAILFCSHRQAVVAREVVVDVDNDRNELQIWPWDIPCYLPWPFPWPRPWPCPPPPTPPPPPPPPPSPPPPPPRSPPPPPPCSPPPPPPCSPPPPPPRSPPPPPPCSPPPPPPRSPPPPPPCPPPPAPATSCSASDKEKVKTCMFNTTSIDECCPTFQSILGTSCPCYKYAEDLDNQVLITLEAYCDVDSPCRGVPSPPPLPPKPSCLASDKEKVKTCMFNTTSIDECCPTFQSILGKSCPCYKYAEDLDNQVLITLKAYCDVNSPCKGVQSPPPLPPKPSCSASDKEKVKTCMFNTTSIDECCPTFQSILGKSCPCYKYGEDLDNQLLITLEAYCDLDSPCKGVQVIKLSKEE